MFKQHDDNTAIMVTQNIQMTGFEIMGIKLSTWFGGTGLFMAISSMLLGFLTGIEDIPFENGIIASIFFMGISAYFRYTDVAIKKREQSLKENKDKRENDMHLYNMKAEAEKHEIAMEIVEKTKNGEITYDPLFVSKFLDKE